MQHLNTDELNAGLDQIRQSPQDSGRLDSIVRRPQSERREELQTGELNDAEGLAGDCWNPNGAASSGDPPRVETQLTLMNSRTIALIAQERDRWKLAGDQLYLDLDLSTENLPPGTRLAIGEAVIEITAEPHTGCRKFIERFGRDAMLWVNSDVGRELNLRGIYARVTQPGRIEVGQTVRKLSD
ncbi:MAG: MOSC domain-containing protein [Planctomycetota bacterium]|nr:MAG: MOSC domain-containing protein [Planctomycetota bacterium]REK25798.1 MAG: MOSC domain-containing protein [Planctomycetota bacterium]REK35380.1 MAG: MOSC domain-containing protein [Planctomycetota bacterium]